MPALTCGPISCRRGRVRPHHLTARFPNRSSLIIHAGRRKSPGYDCTIPISCLGDRRLLSRSPVFQSRLPAVPTVKGNRDHLRLAFLPVMYPAEVVRKNVEPYRDIVGGIIVAYPVDRADIERVRSVLNGRFGRRSALSRVRRCLRSSCFLANTWMAASLFAPLHRRVPPSGFSQPAVHFVAI